MLNIYQILIDYPVWKLSFALLFLFMLLSYCWWFFAYSPLALATDSYVQQIQAFTEQKKLAHSCKKKCRELQEELKNKKAEVAQLNITEKIDPYTAIERIVQLIEKNKITIQNYSHQKARHSFLFLLAGTFYNVMAFLADFETDCLYTYKKLMLKKIDETYISCELTVTF